MKKSMPTLSQFAKIIRTNKGRLKRLHEDLAYARYLFYSVQGVDYGKPFIQQSTPQFDKMTIDLDRIDRIEKKILYYRSFDNLWPLWCKILTGRELQVFHKVYMQDKKEVDAGAELGVSI